MTQADMLWSLNLSKGYILEVQELSKNASYLLSACLPQGLLLEVLPQEYSCSLRADISKCSRLHMYLDFTLKLSTASYSKD